MKNKVLFLILFLSITTTYGQVRFERGYLIDNENRKIGCFIKNYEWEKNPGECEYKLTENGDTKKGNITSIKEFSVYGSSKYTRVKTRIERSQTESSELRNPTLNQEQLFLKVLVQGKASLYNYTEENSTNFFYSVSDSPIQQLVCRKYLNNNNKIVINNIFRQQLLNDVNCANTTITTIKSIDYSEGALERYFKKYNECAGDSFIVYDHKINRGKFNLRVTPGIDYTSLSVFTYSRYSKSRTIDFDNQINFRLGLEAEYILPFYKNKWGILFEPTYQHFNSQKVTSSMDRAATMNYRSIEMAAGIRYYFLLNDRTKIFINGFLNSVASLNFNSKLDIPNDLDSTIRTLKMDEKSNVALGCGIDYKRLSVEFRYYSPQKIMVVSQEWTSKYQKYSFIIGCNLLKTSNNKN